MLWILDVPEPGEAFRALDPAQRRRRALESVKRLLLRESQVQPLLLVFEDLHWVDTETQAVLDGLAESLGSAPILLAVSYRPDYQRRVDPLPRCFKRALALARGRALRSRELRAATSLARLWRDHGRREEARRLLAAVFGEFTEGFDTHDLLAARALLDELGP